MRGLPGRGDVGRHERPRSRRWWFVGLAALAAGGVTATALVGLGAAGPHGSATSVVTPDGAPMGQAAPGDARDTSGRATPDPTPSTNPSAQPGPDKDAYVFPVLGTASYARTHHDYPASDIIAPCGAPVRAVHPGIVLEVSRTDTYDPRTDDGAERGGRFVSLLGDDGVRYYGSHLRAVAPGIDVGVRVGAGQRIGTVGRSGHASACHLHFGISPPCAGTGDWWVRRGVVWPWSYLDSWRRHKAASPAGKVSAWRKAHGCPTAPG